MKCFVLDKNSEINRLNLVCWKALTLDAADDSKNQLYDYSYPSHGDNIEQIAMAVITGVGTKIWDIMLFCMVVVSINFLKIV